MIYVTLENGAVYAYRPVIGRSILVSFIRIRRLRSCLITRDSAKKHKV